MKQVAKRVAAWLLVLFVIAAALAGAAGAHGSVALFWPPYRLDMSLRVLLLLLLALFVLLYLAMRAFAGMHALPQRVRQRRQTRQQQAQGEYTAQLLGALAAAQAGRWARARTAANGVLEHTRELPTEDCAALRHAAALLAAESAQALGDTKARDALLDGALQAAGDAGAAREGALLRAAQWALEDGDAQSALARLDALPPAAARRTQARRLRLYAMQMAGQDAAPLEHQLTRHALLPGQSAGNAPETDAASPQ